MDMPQEVKPSYIRTTVQDTLAARKNTHGDFALNGLIMQNLKQCIRDMPGWNELSPAQKEALDMICHKMGRILTGNPNEPDHWHDIAGYAVLVENIILTGKSHKV